MPAVRSWVSWPIIAAVALSLGAGAYWVWSTYGQSSATSQYVTVPIERGSLRKVATAAGALSPVSTINVGTQISGVVKAVHVDFNDTVTKGQLLAELDRSLLTAQLRQSMANLNKAEATLKLANLKLERTRKLLAKGFAAPALFDEATQVSGAAFADVAVARAQVSRDQTNIAFTVIRSPVPGVILSRDVDAGQTVAASLQTPTLFKIAPDLRKMQIDTAMSEADIGGLKPGLKAAFTVDAFPGRSYAGVVRQIRMNPANVQNVVTYNVVVDVANPDLTLLPGMTAFVSVLIAERQNVLLAPNSALRFRPAGAAVRNPRVAADRPQSQGQGEEQRTASTRGRSRAIYVLRDGQPARMEVSVGMSDGKLSEISGVGLEPGLAVITGDTTTAQRRPSRNTGFGPRF
jgi:HlyD family secretion protein